MQETIHVKKSYVHALMPCQICFVLGQTTTGCLIDTFYNNQTQFLRTLLPMESTPMNRCGIQIWQ